MSISPPPAGPSLSGSIEPHASLLTQPADDHALYKIMTLDNLLYSIDGAYLHFNRVDSYKDGPGTDPHDGAQLPADQPGNAGVVFEKAPHFTAAHYYDQSRSRTYACCFGLENADHLWRNYANGSPHGKIGIEFGFGHLRAQLNAFMATEGVGLVQGDNTFRQFFDINYGIVTYVDWDRHRANTERLANPIQYTFLKAQAFSPEQEFRISLSTIGVLKFVMKDGSPMIFPPSLHLHFDFRAAFADGTIRQILCGEGADTAYLRAELEIRGILPAPGSAIT